MSLALARNVGISVDVTPQEMAAVFASYSSTEQAEFFNEFAVVAAKWDKPLAFQFQAITDEQHLSPDARFVMKQIGDYAYKT